MCQRFTMLCLHPPHWTCTKGCNMSYLRNPDSRIEVYVNRKYCDCDCLVGPPAPAWRKVRLMCSWSLWWFSVFFSDTSASSKGLKHSLSTAEWSICFLWCPQWVTKVWRRIRLPPYAVLLQILIKPLTFVKALVTSDDLHVFHNMIWLFHFLLCFFKIPHFK